MIYCLRDLESRSVMIGRMFDNILPTVQINVKPLLDRFAGASVSLVAVRPGEDGGYVTDTSVNDGILSWVIHRGDVELVG